MYYARTSLFSIFGVFCKNLRYLDNNWHMQKVLDPHPLTSAYTQSGWLESWTLLCVFVQTRTTFLRSRESASGITKYVIHVRISWPRKRGKATLADSLWCLAVQRRVVSSSDAGWKAALLRLRTSTLSHYEPSYQIKPHVSSSTMNVCFVYLI